MVEAQTPPSPTASEIVWITGAGSGVGRASAVRLARSGRTIVLSGRRPDALADTAALVEQAGGIADVVPLDVADAAAIGAAHADIRSRLGTVSGLVLSAGLNAPQRYWRDQSIAEFAAIVQTNLVGVAAIIDATLPGMRESGGGTVVVVSSYAGWRFSPDAGVAYSASKTALKRVTETLNAQENVNGVRACHLCPGDIDTEFLAQRPVEPDAVARRSMLAPDDVARAVEFVVESPAGVCIDELVIAPTKQGVRAG